MLCRGPLFFDREENHNLLNLVYDDVVVLEAETDVADGGLGLLGDDLAQVTLYSPMQRDHFVAR